MARIDGRKYNDLRPLTLTPGCSLYAEGSCLIEQGNTRVFCTASVEEGVPFHKKGSGEGWVTAEYSMLPRANRTRSQRDISRLKLAGRSAEIQRLIGRALRSVIDLRALGELTITVDCDVLQADGGTRCASITGGFIALALAGKFLRDGKYLKKNPVIDYVAALSTGIIPLDGRDSPILDMCYEEDSSALADFNLVMTGAGSFVEVQGTGEGRPYTADEFSNVLRVTTPALQTIIKRQKEIVTL